MNNKILADLDFASIISESSAQTKTGEGLLNKYKSFLLANESTCNLVNNFVKEANVCRYDNGINSVLETVADFINANKTVWALSTACENIESSNNTYSYLNKNAAKQVEKLLEMDEDNVVKYIKAGALKNVMFCESFRSIAKQVFQEQPIIESNADYTVVHPVSMVENVGDGLCFEVAGTLYKMGDDKSVQEAQWSDVSNTFKNISSLLESNIVNVDNGCIDIKAGNGVYTIKEAGKCTRTGKDGEKEMTIDQLRENNNLVVMSTNPRFKNQMASVLESIALLCENYESVVNMDNVAIYSTRNDQFVVIESGSNMYATLLNSNHNAKWTINENAVETLSFIKAKTNTQLSDVYNEAVSKHIEQVSEEEKMTMEAELKSQSIANVKDRIANLTEKFKNDPTKLAVLSSLAQKIATIE